MPTTSSDAAPLLPDPSGTPEALPDGLDTREGTDGLAAGAGLTGRARAAWFLRLSLRPVLIYLASRIGVLSVAGAVSYDEHRSLAHSLIAWDALWYTDIARHGYLTAVPHGSGPAAVSNLGFFPLVPLCTAVVHVVTGATVGQAGLLVAFGSGLTAAVAVFWLLCDVTGLRGATRGTALVFLSPGAFVLSMVYSEGLLITLTACALMALRRHRWLLAGVCAGLATATDPVAAAIVVACAVASIQAIRARREWRSLLAPLLAPAGIAGFFAYLWVHVGTPFAWFLAQRRGFQGGSYFGGVPRAFSVTFSHGFSDVNSYVKMTSFLVAVVLVWCFLRYRPPATWIAYVATVLAMGIFSPIIGVTPRLLLRGYPLIGLFGARLPEVWFEAILGLSALVMAALAIMAMGSPGFTP